MKKVRITIRSKTGYVSSFELVCAASEVNDLMGHLERSGFEVSEYAVNSIERYMNSQDLDKMMFDACESAMQHLLTGRQYDAMMASQENDPEFKEVDMSPLEFITNDEAIEMLEKHLDPHVNASVDAIIAKM